MGLRYPSMPIMLVDDEIDALKGFEITLRSNGINNLLSCNDSRDVFPVLGKQDVSIILLDLSMPDISGEYLLAEIAYKFPDVLRIVITGINEVDTAVKCMKTGAFDYLVKPVERDILIASVKRALNVWELQNENRSLKKYVLSGELDQPAAFSEIVTKNKTMISIFKYIESVALTSQPVLITGETGVGKELIAKAIYKVSKRKGNFIPVNAPGIDDNVFSDTLFGHVKGAFTGAHEMRKGLIENASSGTIFLDEIGDLSIASQTKLLRLLQEQEYFPVGSDIQKKSDVRVIVATNKSPQELQNSSDFRKDLYYRLRSHHIHLPPLRERPDDLPLLVDCFLDEASRSLKKKRPTPPNELLPLLSTYNFPGNIRELKSMIFDAVSNHKSRILSLNVFKNWIFNDKTDAERLSCNLEAAPEICDKPSEPSIITFSSRLPTLKQTAMLLIEEALKRSNKNQNIAAKQLGISRQALNKRLQPDKKGDNLAV